MNSLYQYQAPKVPDRWGEEERRYARGVQDLFDILFAFKGTYKKTIDEQVTMMGALPMIVVSDTKPETRPCLWFKPVPVQSRASGTPDEMDVQIKWLP